MQTVPLKHSQSTSTGIQRLLQQRT
jgi:hypothetical protein